MVPENNDLDLKLNGSQKSGKNFDENLDLDLSGLPETSNELKDEISTNSPQNHLNEEIGIDIPHLSNNESDQKNIFNKRKVGKKLNFQKRIGPQYPKHNFLEESPINGTDGKKTVLNENDIDNNLDIIDDYNSVPNNKANSNFNGSPDKISFDEDDFDTPKIKPSAGTSDLNFGPENKSRKVHTVEDFNIDSPEFTSPINNNQKGINKKVKNNQENIDKSHYNDWIFKDPINNVDFSTKSHFLDGNVDNNLDFNQKSSSSQSSDFQSDAINGKIIQPTLPEISDEINYGRDTILTPENSNDVLGPINNPKIGYGNGKGQINDTKILNPDIKPDNINHNKENDLMENNNIESESGLDSVSSPTEDGYLPTKPLDIEIHDPTRFDDNVSKPKLKGANFSSGNSFGLNPSTRESCNCIPDHSNIDIGDRNRSKITDSLPSPSFDRNFDASKSRMIKKTGPKRQIKFARNKGNCLYCATIRPDAIYKNTNKFENKRIRISPKHNLIDNTKSDSIKGKLKNNLFKDTNHSLVFPINPSNDKIKEEPTPINSDDDYGNENKFGPKSSGNSFVQNKNISRNIPYLGSSNRKKINSSKPPLKSDFKYPKYPRTGDNGPVRKAHRKTNTNSKTNNNRVGLEDCNDVPNFSSSNRKSLQRFGKHSNNPKRTSCFKNKGFYKNRSSKKLIPNSNNTKPQKFALSRNSYNKSRKNTKNLLQNNGRNCKRNPNDLNGNENNFDCSQNIAPSNISDVKNINNYYPYYGYYYYPHAYYYPYNYKY